jgi:uncharacterized delta-60 repeat protein
MPMKESNLVRTLTLAASFLLQVSTLCPHSRGAAGDVDLSFDPGSGVNGEVNAVALQPDGKVIIAGYFSTVRGFQRFKVARLNADGSGDSSFNPTASVPDLSNVDWVVSAVALQPDGKVLIGGSFIIGNNNFGIARLNSNGSFDASFNPGFGVQASVASIAVQPDGKVLIGGGVFIGGTNITGVARLNSNGSFDSSFSSAIGYGSAYCVALQPDGKVLVGGSWYIADGVRFCIARLNANGSVDSSFNPGRGPDSSVHSILLQANGKILLGGAFTSVNGTNRNGIARLNVDGSLDIGFSPGAGVNSLNPEVRSIVAQSDGKVLIGGNFLTGSNTNRTSIARLNVNGSLDDTFNPDLGNVVLSIALQPDGRILAGGHATGASQNRIARFNGDGNPDDSFQAGSVLEMSFSSLVVQPDNKVLLGGPLTYVSGTNRNGSIRLNADGSLDSTFIADPDFNPGFGVRHYTPHPGGDIHYNIANPTAATVQSDGKVLVGVRHEYWQCDAFEGGCVVNTFYYMVRLNADGSSDSSFSTNSGGARSIIVQPDGKVLANGLIRFNPNGSVDTSFNAGTPNAGVSSAALQADGKVIIVGGFTAINGNPHNGIARLNANGSLDASFNPAAAGFVAFVVIQPDGKVLIAGDFTNVNGTNRNHIARLNADGSLDLSFNPGTGADGSVYVIALQSDGNIVVGGDFTLINGAVRPRVARLYGDAVVLHSLNIARSNAFVIVSRPATALNFHLQETTNLALPNSWSPVAQPAVTNGAQISVTVPLSVGPKFFRLKSQ